MTRYLPLLLLAVLPFGALALGGDFYLNFLTRVLIFALAAASLNFVVGYGGMVCFGQAAFFGIGAYAAGILVASGQTNLIVMLLVAVAVAGIAAAIVGAISLRTRGVYFIMITLAFAQMVYYLAVSLRAYGGDDGLTLPLRGSLGPLNLKDPLSLYFTVAVLVALAFWFLFRVEHARFGRVIQAIRDNEGRTGAIGVPVFRYQLACFAIGGALAGLAGMLLANLNGFVSPSLLSWHQSGHLLIMVILGGVGARWGGFWGALAVLGIEEAFAEFTLYWQVGLAAVLLTVVLVARQGISGALGMLKRVQA
ncbi:branched-chain amino acid ABC transporter permease [Lacibacterium aquatile]|uniref:Branched-chain amino acid ABC transporter permease n=1 Tax=Lacibacterium aquatile TaxID=1168082 RepID=A0ABW5DUX5_9PROT